MNSNENEAPPDDLIDPIGYILITEPVLLPSSNIILDKSIIMKHLLVSNNDPFTRVKLTIDELNEFNNGKMY